MSYGNKLKYYADPEGLAAEFIENLSRGKSELEVTKLIGGLKHLVARNM